jgi:hypothetical protein
MHAAFVMSLDILVIFTAVLAARILLPFMEAMTLMFATTRVVQFQKHVHSQRYLFIVRHRQEEHNLG